MSYGQYEVVTYGGGEVFRDTFNAIALMAGAGPIDSLCRLALLLGLAMLIFKAAFDFNVGGMTKWFLMAAIIYGVVWIPRVQVHVTDKFNVALAGADVANVPLGVAFVSATSSEVGDSIIHLTETSFSDPQGLAYSNAGMIYGAKLFSQMAGWQIIDPHLSLSMQSYIHDCIADDIIANNIAMDQLENSTQLWAFLESNANPAYQTQSWTSGTQPSTVSCQRAAANIDQLWGPEIAQNAQAQEKRLEPAFQNGTLGTQISQTVPSLTQATFGTSSSSTDFFKQALTITALQQSFATYAALAPGSNGMQNFSAMQSQNQANASGMQVGLMAQKAIPVLQIVMTVLFIAMFPVMAPAFLLPSMGLKMMQAYFAGFLYLQLWGPMYVILNKLFLYVTASQTAAATFLPAGVTVAGGQMAITFANLPSASSTNQMISNVAGMMMLSIPVIAGALTKGAMDMGGHAGSMLGSMRQAAESSGVMAATRNVSLGQTALDNVQFQNASARQVTTSPHVDTGQFSANTPSGDIITTTANGSTIFTGAKSTGNFSTSVGHGLSSEFSQRATQEHQRGEAIKDSWSKGQTQAASAIMERFNAVTSGTEARSSTGQDTRDGISDSVTAMQQTSASLQRNFGYSKQQADDFTRHAAGEMFAGGGAKVDLGTPKVLGTDVGLSGEGGVKGSAGVRKSWSNTTSSREALDFARGQLAQNQFSQKADRSAQTFATENYSNFGGSSAGTRASNSNTFTNSASVSKAIEDSESRSQSYSQLASQAESGRFDRTTEYSSAQAQYLVDTAIGKKNGLYGSTLTMADLPNLLNPRGADAVQWVGLRDELSKGFYSQLAGKVEPRPEIAAAHEMGDAASSPGKFSLRSGSASLPEATRERGAAYMEGERRLPPISRPDGRPNLAVLDGATAAGDRAESMTVGLRPPADPKEVERRRQQSFASMPTLEQAETGAAKLRRGATQ